MTFLNPILLYGMATIAAPIIIHLFMNRKIKPVVWAAMRFLHNAVLKSKRRMNMEDILLLLLRCLILILLALALARPVLTTKDGGIGGIEKGSETAVIVIDNSYSMGQSDGGASRFDQARQAAEQVVNSLSRGSSVAVFLFSDIVRAVIPEPTYDLNLAGKIIREATLSDRPTNLSMVLKYAMDTFARHPGGLKRIYLITDGQATGWRQFSEIDEQLRTPDVKTRVILVGNPEEHNLCVSDIQLASSIATAGEAAQFNVEVSNFGTAEAKDVAVRISVDDESPSDEGIIEKIPAGASKRLSLFTKLRTGGYHTVTGQINSDHLAADDHRTLALRAHDDIRVLLVSGDTGAEPMESALFYLNHALTPVRPSAREDYFIKTKTIGFAELETAKLDDYEAVVLANVPDVSKAALDSLRVYVDRGGGLIIFPGSRTNVGFYNENLGKKFALLPATFGELHGKPDQREKFFTLQSKEYTHPIVSIWSDPNAGTLASAHFYSAYELVPDAGHTAQAGEAQVVLKYSDGTPAVMERTWGRGRVILFSSSANTAWNDLPLHPAYLPLIDRTLGSILLRKDARLNLPVGSSFEFICDPEWAGKDAIIARESEKKETSSLRRIGMVDNVPILRFDDTDKAGAYDVRIKTDPPTVVKFAAQFDPEESKLATISQGELDSLPPNVQVLHWTEHMHLDEKITKERGGMEIWTTLAMIVIVAACLEIALAGIFSAAK